MFDFNVLVENGMAWLFLVAILFTAVEPVFSEVGKPILHFVRDALADKPRFALTDKRYEFLVRLVKLIITGFVAWPVQYQLDVFANVFGYYGLHPFLGALPAVILSAFFGRYIHDWMKSRMETADRPLPKLEVT